MRLVAILSVAALAGGLGPQALPTDEAVPGLDQALEQLRLARNDHDLGERTRAVERWRNVAQSAPQPARAAAWLELGEDEAAQGRCNAALPFLERTLSAPFDRRQADRAGLGGTQLRAYWARIECWLELGQPRLALAAVRSGARPRLEAACGAAFDEERRRGILAESRALEQLGNKSEALEGYLRLSLLDFWGQRADVGWHLVELYEAARQADDLRRMAEAGAAIPTMGRPPLVLELLELRGLERERSWARLAERLAGARTPAGPLRHSAGAAQAAYVLARHGETFGMLEAKAQPRPVRGLIVPGTADPSDPRWAQYALGLMGTTEARQSLVRLLELTEPKDSDGRDWLLMCLGLSRKGREQLLEMETQQTWFTRRLKARHPAVTDHWLSFPGPDRGELLPARLPSLTSR